MRNLDNPFIITGYEGPRYFCDRNAELSQMRDEIANGSNIALIATRRMGKSGLIQHYFNQSDVQDRYYTFFVDIYDTTSLREFVHRLSKEILFRLKPIGRRAMESFWNTMHSIQPGITFSPMGEPTFNVQLGDITKGETTLEEIFHYLDIADKPCIVAIDEFQQINNYPERNIEAKLRTLVQQCHNAQFIFSGSQRHTMSLMFTNASKPFYQSVSIMHLDAIPMEQYERFAKLQFETGNRHLADGVVAATYSISNGVTWYTQKIFNRLYAQTKERSICTPEHVPESIDYIINTLAYSYEETLFRLPEKQKTVLIALAKNGPTQNITSTAFIRQYKLHSSSSVQSAIRGLLEKDFVTYEKGIYTVYDLFMSIWIRRTY